MPKETFLATIRTAERRESMPRREDTFAFAEFVRPRIVEQSDEVASMSSVNSWLLRRY